MRNLCMAHELAVEAILAERPDAIFVQGESIEAFTAAGKGAQRAAEFANGLKYLSLDLTTGHVLSPGMAAYLSDNGVTSNDLSFFRERRGVGQRWLGTDYYATCDHRVYADGRHCTNIASAIGYRALAAEYYKRYRIPLFHCETNRVAPRAVAWLRQQWSDVTSLRQAGIPVLGFTWYSLTDQVDWQHALRWERDELHPVGLYDLQRRARPVGIAYRDLISDVRRKRERQIEAAGTVRDSVA